MKWTEATTLQLCYIVLYDETATEEDKRAAGMELFSRIGGIGDENNSKSA